MKVYHDQDANLSLLQGKRIAVIGYGNQGRAQAMNLRDSGLDVSIGNREDEYAQRARADAFSVLPIQQAAERGDIVMLLLPDEVVPEIFQQQIAGGLKESDMLSFASGYSIAFGSITPPDHVDVILVAPRMIGAGVRQKYMQRGGFPAFVGVHQDVSGQAKDLALALAKGIGATRFGVVEVTFAQEAELDLFTEQCFGPAFGHVLTTSADLLLEEGYPPEAVLLELYMSGEFSYTLQKIAELGMIEQTALHSPCSQYGSMSRGMRFMLPELRERMREGLDDIRSGRFAQEWADEQRAGCPTVALLKEAAHSLPLYRLERELRAALRGEPLSEPPQSETNAPAAARPLAEAPSAPGATLAKEVSEGKTSQRAAPARATGRLLATLYRFWDRLSGKPQAAPAEVALGRTQMHEVLRGFVANAAADPSLQAFARSHSMTSHYVLRDVGLEFHMRFMSGVVEADIGAPDTPAEVRLETTADVLDGMFTGRINAMRATMTGKLVFKGQAKVAMGLQQIQADLSRLYAEARDKMLAPRH